MTNPTGITVAICCHQSENRLAMVLRGLMVQQPIELPWELLVIDNNCTDATVGVAKNTWSQQPVPLRVLTEKKPGVAFARICALKHCRYSLLAFLDDDTVPSPNWLRAIQLHFEEHPATGAVAGLNHIESDGPIPPWFWEVQRSWAVGPAADGPRAGALWTAGLVVRVEVWNRLRELGFRHKLVGRRGSELTSGADTELTAAIGLAGWELRYDSQLTLTHHIPPHRLTLDYASRLYRAFGKASIWLDAYFRVSNGKQDPWTVLKRQWWVQALAEFIRASVYRLWARRRGRTDVPLLLQALHRFSRAQELCRARTDYTQFYKTVGEAPWRLRRSD